jgi:hypothetical protein
MEVKHEEESGGRGGVNERRVVEKAQERTEKNLNFPQSYGSQAHHSRISE